MAGVRFTTTRLAGLRAAGRLQEMQHATIAPFLERELGPEYGRLFADFEAESTDTRAWYNDTTRAPRPIASLPEPDAEALRQRVADMIGRIGEFAARLVGESTQKANIARIITAATTFPIEDLWADGEQPLIVNWGFHRHDVEAGVPRPIRDRIRRPGEPITRPVVAGVGGGVAAGVTAQAAASKPKRRWFWLPTLLWIAVVVLVAGSYDRLLPASGIVGPLGLTRLDACPLSTATTRVFAEGAELQALVDAAELAAARHRALCLAPGHASLGGSAHTIAAIFTRP